MRACLSYAMFSRTSRRFLHAAAHTSIDFTSSASLLLWLNSSQPSYHISVLLSAVPFCLHLSVYPLVLTNLRATVYRHPVRSYRAYCEGRYPVGGSIDERKTTEDPRDLSFIVRKRGNPRDAAACPSLCNCSPRPYSTTARNENRVNENHLEICLSFSRKNRN